jgi:DNA-binding transcriptional LysR family regulator
MRYFVAVAEDQQFSKAAARLGVAQSTVSEQVRILEDSLGAELLLRSSRSLRLTPAGEVFLTGRRKLLADIDRLDEVVRKHAQGQSGQLRIGSGGAGAASCCPTDPSPFDTCVAGT